jgi:hypothetical protein
MKLFIKVENGQTVDHPVLAENLVDVFGFVPDNYEYFVRVEPPRDVHPYKKIISTYEKFDDIWKDVHTIVDRTPEEITEVETQLHESLDNELNRLRSLANSRLNIVREKNDTDSVMYLERYISYLDSWKQHIIDLNRLTNPMYPPEPRKTFIVKLGEGAGAYGNSPNEFIFQSDTGEYSTAYFRARSFNATAWDPTKKELKILATLFTKATDLRVGEILYGDRTKAQYIVTEAIDEDNSGWFVPNYVPLTGVIEKMA